MFAKMTAATCLSLLVSAVAAATGCGSVIALDGHDWQLAPDPKNVGVAEKWYEAPRPEAKPAKVPGLIQDVFPGYAGAAWFWRDVVIPANPHQGGRYLLRFWEVDYVADVWVNGTHVGRHEGAQAKFTLDITSAVKPGVTNRIAVRVLSPFNQPIGRFRPQPDAARRLHLDQYRRDHRFRGACRRAAGSHGRLFVRADPKSGQNSH